MRAPMSYVSYTSTNYKSTLFFKKLVQTAVFRFVYVNYRRYIINENHMSDIRMGGIPLVDGVKMFSHSSYGLVEIQPYAINLSDTAQQY